MKIDLSIRFATMSQNSNHELAQIFKKLSAIYKLSGTKDSFRALAYQRAYRTIDGLEKDVKEYIHDGKMEKLQGIGESISAKIIEYLNTGKIGKYEQLKEKFPHELIDLLEVKGFGPQSLKKIYTELGIKTKEQLVKALDEGKIAALKGFGKKKVEQMKRGLKIYNVTEERMLLWEALQLGETIVEEMKKCSAIKNIELAGSLRRKKETIGDIDLLVASSAKDRKNVVSYFVSMENVKEVLAKGDTKASIILISNNRQVDLRIIDPSQWGAALQYFTGSKEHNVHLREIAKEKDLKINEYGVFRLKDNKCIAGETEEEVYHALGFSIMPPEMREDRGEIELSKENKIPKLITLQDMRGDMQMHSQWSDGNASIQEIAHYVRMHYPQYDYIAMTDHSKFMRVAGGIDEKKFMKQIHEIREVNKSIGVDFVKAGAEVDILSDGKLDLNDELLEQLDWVLASIHSGFNRDNTERIIQACENPFVHCIGHPTGRLIGTREGYAVDLQRVIAAAAETGTALEINAQPERMDLDEHWAKGAKEKGVKLVISTDSHQMANFDFIKLGVFIARRAWCTADDILNTHSWNEVHAFTQKKKELIAV